jgi:hypothetical protein
LIAFSVQARKIDAQCGMFYLPVRPYMSSPEQLNIFGRLSYVFWSTLRIGSE